MTKENAPRRVGCIVSCAALFFLSPFIMIIVVFNLGRLSIEHRLQYKVSRICQTSDKYVKSTDNYIKYSYSDGSLTNINIQFFDDGQVIISTESLKVNCQYITPQNTDIYLDLERFIKQRLTKSEYHSTDTIFGDHLSLEYKTENSNKKTKADFYSHRLTKEMKQIRNKILALANEIIGNQYTLFKYFKTNS